MRADNLAVFARLLRRHTGLAIGPEKAYLVESRLTVLARRHGLPDCDSIILLIQQPAHAALAREAFEAMMTHESFFFRDIKPFEEFRQNVLPRLMEQRAESRHIRIWCAAASTGQEPYSLAMILAEEAKRLEGWKVEIVATDIAPAALAYAREGLYTHFEVQRGLPAKFLVKYFTKETTNWRLASPIRKMVSFREFNLLDDPSRLGRFDVVFCRNVLIYFEQGMKGEVLGRIAQQMPSDGYLFLGGAETVIGISTGFAATPGLRAVYSPGTENGDISVQNRGFIPSSTALPR